MRRFYSLKKNFFHFLLFFIISSIASISFFIFTFYYYLFVVEVGTKKMNVANTFIPGLDMDLSAYLYECLCDSLDEAWVKAGTLGSRLTAKVHDGNVYNKPIVKGLLSTMSRDNTNATGKNCCVRWPGLEYDSQLGARVPLPYRRTYFESKRSQRIPKITGNFKVPEISSIHKPVLNASIRTYRRCEGNLWVSVFGDVTVPKYKLCEHDSVSGDFGCELTCDRCGSKFHKPYKPDWEDQ